MWKRCQTLAAQFSSLCSKPHGSRIAADLRWKLRFHSKIWETECAKLSVINFFFFNFISPVYGFKIRKSSYHLFCLFCICFTVSLVAGLWKGYKGVLISKKDKSPYNGMEMPCRQPKAGVQWVDSTCITLTKFINQVAKVLLPWNMAGSENSRKQHSRIFYWPKSSLFQNIQR